MRKSARSERGSATAEFAIALPAAVLVLMMGVTALSAVSLQASLQGAVADAARLVGRGESLERVQQATGNVIGGIRMLVTRSDGIVCVAGEHDWSLGRLIAIPLRAKACALDGGW